MTSASRDASVPGVRPRTPDDCSARLDLPPQRGACAVARSAARQLLRTWEVVDDQSAHDALLVVSELVGNAVRHGSVPLTLDLALEGTVLTVGVTDASPGLPRQRVVDGHEESGRGLTIVTALAQEWGAEPVRSGKRVWARLPVARR